ncbi:hypothetical protein F4809DRAFT_594130 [Biscogniauxia mediterranea]|nr:hypothetical protein F4809DRAFT_594130 [Biscogniauxia mediterranea]
MNIICHRLTNALLLCFFSSHYFTGTPSTLEHHNVGTRGRVPSIPPAATLAMACASKQAHRSPTFIAMASIRSNK